MKNRRIFDSKLTLIPKLMLIIVTFIMSASLSAKKLNIDGNQLALEGYDPVSYFTEQPMKGYPALQIKHNEVVYYFENEENRIAFTQDPEKYVPAYGGWCAWAMLDGDKVEVDPLSYKIINGKNHLYYNGFWGDTLAKWNKKAGKDGEQTLVDAADKEWADLD
ncbi:YHS domain-containing (seleno)protein [Marinomonas sp. MED121]|uniref:YHS domain-containing (seleno)protein n=1 Tax=Marinomonas sp. MED121 TaxID=314277 RepID=UPI0003146557|nr:YHS domain-containing (seleno)protein [Marinomonas sp. MED121]